MSKKSSRSRVNSTRTKPAGEVSSSTTDSSDDAPTPKKASTTASAKTTSTTASAKTTSTSSSAKKTSTSSSAKKTSTSSSAKTTASSNSKPSRASSRDAQRTTAQLSRRERQQQQRLAAARARKRRSRIVTAVGALVLAGVLFVVGFVLYKNWDDKRKAEQAVRDVQVYPPNTNADHTALKLGIPATVPNAPTLSIYEDYQCPGCKSLEGRYGKLFAQLAASGKVNVEIRTLTFLDLKLRNQSSTQAAQGAACAAIVGKYQEYHDVVYANQPEQEGVGYTQEQLRVTFAEQSGITGNLLTTFQDCYDRKRTYTIVNEISTHGSDVDKINSTPTLKVNGKDPKWDYTDTAGTTTQVPWWQTLDASEEAWIAAINKVAANADSSSTTPSPTPSP